MSVFSFVTDAKSEAFCLQIAAKMIRLFGITEREAVGRIDQQFQGKEWVGETHLYYHEGLEDWAKTIYYEEDTYWWVDTWMAEHNPQPKPFPRLPD